MTAESKSLPSLRLSLHSRPPSPRRKGAEGEGIQLTIIQALKYALVGVSNTIIDAATYYALTRALGLASLPILAKSIAYAIGMINSFYWNRTWTFKSQSNPWRAALLFTLTHVAALGINTGVMALGLSGFHLGEAIALILATSAVFAWNFILNKQLVFKSA